jgi:hypothetical protein
MPRGKPKQEPREEVQPSDTWMCCLCEDRPHFDGQRAFFAHAAEVHPELIEEKESGGRTIRAKSTASHVDAATWFSWDYTWMLPDGRQLAAQSVVQPRAKNDPMRWS